MATKRLGILIAVEGIDGSGKTTFCEKLALKLGPECVVFQEPTNISFWGIEIRKFLNGKLKLTKKEQLAYFMLDRVYDVNYRILPALAMGDIVILDRYYYSTGAYQGSRDVMPKTITALSERQLDCPVPDITIWLKLDVEKALERIKKRKMLTSIFEIDIELNRINNNYEEIFKHASSVVLEIDASEDIETVVSKVYIKLKKYL